MNGDLPNFRFRNIHLIPHTGVLVFGEIPPVVIPTSYLVGFWHLTSCTENIPALQLFLLFSMVVKSEDNQKLLTILLIDTFGKFINTW